MLSAAATAFDLFNKGLAVRGLARAAGAFRAAPSVQTAFQVGGRLVGVVGTDRVVGALVKHGVRIALRSRGVDESAADDMVGLMRARVPQDTGALLNGIDSEADGRVVTVTASGVRTSAAGKAEEDYARFVEYGTRPGQRGGSLSYVADEGFYSGNVRPTARTRRVYRTHPGTPAQPFFWPSVDEALARRKTSLDAVAAEIPQELA